MRYTQIYTRLLLCVLAAANITMAKDAYIVSAGFQRKGFAGEGENENHFGFGNGYNLEFGITDDTGTLCYILYGYCSSSHLNYVKQNEAEATFTVPYYTEFRYMDKKKGYQLFYFGGLDVNKVKFKDTKGADVQVLWSIGIGAIIPVRDRYFLQPKFKPYYIGGNSLGQKFGVALQLSVGYGPFRF